MTDTRHLHVLKALLFPQQAVTAFAILEGASMPDLPQTLYSFRPEHRCLYRGELEPDMAEVAPYLVILDRDAPFTYWLLLNGWGRNWGIFGVSRADIAVLNRHFRRHVRVALGDRTVYFRYYSPHVMRNYLPSCDADQLRTIFGPVLMYLTEDEDPQFADLFWLQQDNLRQRVLPLRDPRPVSPDYLHSVSARDEATAKGGRLLQRAEQSKKVGESIYVERMSSYLYECFPETKQVPRDEMGRTILELTDRAAGYKLILETHVAPFIVAAWLFGRTFDEDFKAAKEVLEDYEMDTGMKAQWLWNFIEATVDDLPEE